MEMRGFTCDGDREHTGIVPARGLSIHPEGWLTVYGPGPAKHFCSWRCLKRYIDAKGNRLAQLDDGVI